MDRLTMRRRDFLAAGSALALGAGRAEGQGQNAGLIIRGAFILSMDEKLGELRNGDIHVRAGRIAAIAPSLTVEGAEIFEAKGMIAMPGIVDTHWHMWNSLLRGLVGGAPQTGYFPTVQKYGPHYTAVDTYAATRLALAEALNAGITTVHNWAHNIRDPGHADASIRAHESIGLRARFSYGSPQGSSPEKLQDLEDMARLQGSLLISSRANRIALGAALRGPQMSSNSVWRREFDVAKKLKLPISVHVTGNKDANEKYKVIQTLDKAGLLGPDVQLIHAVHATSQDIEIVARTKAHVSVSPYAESANMGVAPVNTFRKAGILTTLSIDNTALPSSVDPFALMRLLVNLLKARDGLNSPFGPREALQMATLDGARALGLEDRCGSLTPGKQADLILIRSGDLSLTMAGENDVDRMLMVAQPANVDSVMVDGAFLKRHGRVNGVDLPEVIRAARASTQQILVRAG